MIVWELAPFTTLMLFYKYGRKDLIRANAKSSQGPWSHVGSNENVLPAPPFAKNGRAAQGHAAMIILLSLNNTPRPQVNFCESRALSCKDLNRALIPPGNPAAPPRS